MTPESDSPLPVSERGGRIGFWVHVSPRSRRAGVGGVHGDALRVAVTEPPLGGRANAAVVALLAGALGISRAEVKLQSGAKGRRKRVEIDARDEGVRPRLQSLATASGAG